MNNYFLYKYHLFVSTVVFQWLHFKCKKKFFYNIIHKLYIYK